MRYYEVYVSEQRHQKTTPLTYASEDKLSIGSLVAVPFGSKDVAGFVAAEVEPPDFETKPLSALLTTQPLPATCLQLHQWMLDYYPGGSGTITQAFVPSGLSVKSRAKKYAPKQSVSLDLPPLTDDQQVVLKTIETSEKRTFLLHGETGSGKTRVYFELAARALQVGRSALILTPEISLVPQLTEAFANYFDDQVVVLHSGLTKATRNRNWLKILHSKEPLIVIGTRSAVFAPLTRVGLIVVDEMHEPAYKQESAPRYQTLRAAAQAGKLHSATVLYGSATPPLVEYYLAERTGVPILRMSHTAKPAAAVKSTIVDLKDNTQFSRHSYLSNLLLQAVEDRLNREEQSLLFLNRRGTARAVLCKTCGWQAMCPRCDTPLTYHGDNHTMRCHTCGYHSRPPYVCPVCQSSEISYRSLGTKALVDALTQLFPQAVIRRFDTDNLADEQLSRHFSDVQAGKVDILVGTQLLGKGLDLPMLSLVGIVNADTSLSMPDFSSAERSYQLLHQAIGRVGRGHRQGEVIVQSFHPQNPLLQAALEQNWRRFYDQEIKEREQFSFPPFSYLLKITVSRRTSQGAERYIRNLRTQAARLGLKAELNEPTPSFYERSHSLYNWQMIVRAKQRPVLVELIQNLPTGNYTADLDPANLL